MLRWFSVIAAAAALAFVPAAAAGNPVAALYSDFAADGVLACHSKADLRAVLGDATLQQYGDPLTMIGLKLAARKQLAGGCRHSTVQSAAAPGSSGSQADRQPTKGARPKNDRKESRSGRSGKPAAPSPARLSSVGGSTDEHLLLGSGLLLLTLATGGWAARRAFNSKR